MTVIRPDDRPQGLLRSYRRTGRVSFLFPSWLNAHPHRQLHLSQRLKRWKIKLQLTLNKLFFHATLQNKASQAYLKAMIDECELRDFGDNPPIWQKNLIHQRRQNQLACFEVILKAHDELTTDAFSEVSKPQTFPEIMLVMAKTLIESNQNQPELIHSAHELVNAYQRVTNYLFDQTKKWHVSQVQFDTPDAFISHLLDFRKAWVLFRQTRLQQIRRQPSYDHALANQLTSHFNSSNPEEMEASS